MSNELTLQQQKAIDKFSKLKVGALFMKMGTGKTRAGLEIVRNTNPDFLLYLTPVSTKDNIEQELQKWGCPCDYKIVGYESIASSDKIFNETLKLVDNDKRCFIIADESIFIKRKRTKRFQRAAILREYCEWALILNGTPITRNEWDLINQMDFLSPKIIPRNSYNILETFFVENNIKKNGRNITFYTFFEGNRPLLTKLCAPYIFEADLEFGHKVEEKTYWVKVSDKEDFNYDMCKNAAIENAKNHDEAILNLIVACQNFVSCIESKNLEVADYIKDKRIICFCTHKKEIKQLSKMVDCYVISGETKLKERKQIIKEFESNNKPLLLSLGVGSYSLNLQFCDEIVYSSISYDYGKMEQSKYRIKRTGQQNDIKYTYILSDLKINDLMFKNLDKKQSLADITKELIEQHNVEDYVSIKQIAKAL